MRGKAARFSCAVVSALCVFLTCGACACLFAYALHEGFPGIEEPETISETEIPLEPGVLDSPTVAELQTLASSLLTANGWTSSSDLTSVSLFGVPCSGLVVADTAFLVAVDNFFDLGIPSTEFGKIYLDSAKGTAWVVISPRTLRWSRPGMETARVNLELDDALEAIPGLAQNIASRTSGNGCNVFAELHEYRWTLEYRIKEDSGETTICSAIVDARTGKARCTGACCP